jgi:capsular exopolysaccharide synthesis family protein
MAFLREYLEADVGRKDDIITVSIDTPYPEEAARIVSAVVDVYQQVSMQERENASTKLLRTLEKSKADNDAEMRQIDNAMYEFRKANPTLAFDQIVSAEVIQINQAYVAAQLAAIDIRSKFPSGHPQVRAAQKLEEELYNRKEQSIKRYVDLNAKMADFARLKAEYETKQEFSRRVMDRIKQLEIAASTLPLVATIEVIEPPRAARSPSYPRKYRTLAVALMAGTMLGCGVALLRDRLDGRMRSVEEIQTIIGLPVLGVVPQMSGRRTAVARAMTVHLDPRSVVAEAYRTVRTAVYFGAGSNRCKTILVTSPEPGDGKTTSASNLAIAIAQTGRRVLLLDADFRKPTQHKNLDIKDSIGLSSVLAGREPVSKAIQHTGVEGLDILPCGPIPANPSEILNSREFGELIDSLAVKYDHILFDSPPVNAVTDARILGAVCDASLLVLRADKSTRKSGEHARNALLGVGARVLGVIVNDAPHRKGYEVYGGSYYGQADVAVRPTIYEPRATRQSLPHLSAGDDDPRQKRDIA